MGQGMGAFTFYIPNLYARQLIRSSQIRPAHSGAKITAGERGYDMAIAWH